MTFEYRQQSSVIQSAVLHRVWQRFNKLLIRCDIQRPLMVINDEAGLGAVWLADVADERAVYRNAAGLLRLAEISGKLRGLIQRCVSV